MGKPGVRKISRYGGEFKVTAVKLSNLPDVLIQDVAAALDIHPFRLSRWRREVREGDLVAKRVKVDVATAAELARLRELERKYAILKKEHEEVHGVMKSSVHGVGPCLPHDKLDFPSTAPLNLPVRARKHCRRLPRC
ncbi:MAG: transposase [Pyrinomonadaceae bacterium]